MANNNENTVTLNLKQLSLFKNGYAFAVRKVEKVELTPEQSTNPSSVFNATILHPPNSPVLGTLWTDTPDAKVIGFETFASTRPVIQDCIELPELIQANIGNVVQLKVMEGEHPIWIQGKLLTVKRLKRALMATSENPTASQTTPFPYGLPTPSTSPTGARVLVPQQNGNLVTIQTDSGIMALCLSTIIAIKGDNLYTTVKVDEPTKAFRFRLTNVKAKELNMDLKYLTYGITWNPSYLITLPPTDDKSLPLTFMAKAAILNDADSDFKVDKLNCLAGFPNIAFKHANDPMANLTTVQGFLSSLDAPAEPSSQPYYGGYPQPRRPNIMSNSIMSQQIMTQAMPSSYPDYGVPSPSSNNNNDGQASSDTTDDIHQYSVENVHIPAQGRVSVPLFQSELSYVDKYHAEINVSTETAVTDSQYLEAWHSLEMKNTSGFTWTTAPISIVRNNVFLAQDTMTYTSAGTTALVKITKALELKIRQSETGGVFLGNITINKHTYRKEQIQGTFEVTNVKSIPITVVLKGKVFGKITKESLKPKAISTTFAWNQNSNNQVTWEFNVEAGATYTLTYTRETVHY